MTNKNEKIPDLLVSQDVSVVQKNTHLYYFALSLYQSKKNISKFSINNDLSFSLLLFCLLLSHTLWSWIGGKNYAYAGTNSKLLVTSNLPQIAHCSEDQKSARLNIYEILGDQFQKPNCVSSLASNLTENSPASLTEKSKNQPKNTRKRAQQQSQFLVGLGFSGETHDFFSAEVGQSHSTLESINQLKQCLRAVQEIQLTNQDFEGVNTFFTQSATAFLNDLKRVLGKVLENHRLVDIDFTDFNRVVQHDFHSGLSAQKQDGSYITLNRLRLALLLDKAGAPPSTYQGFQEGIDIYQQTVKKVNNLRRGIDSFRIVQPSVTTWINWIEQNQNNACFTIQPQAKRKSVSTVSPNLQVYSPSLPFLNLNVGASYDFLNDTFLIGIGKVHFRPFMKDRIGLMVGLDAGWRYTPHSNVFLNHSYDGQYMRVFTGLGVCI